MKRFRNWIIAGAVGVVLTCVCLSVIVALNPSAATATPGPVAQSTQPEQSTSAPTEPPENTVTPAPTDTPVPTPTDTPPPAGETRDNPILAGTPVDIGGDMVFAILEMVRPADDIVRRGNQFNTKPETGQEYAQLSVQIECKKASSDKCSFFNIFKAVGADGNVHEPALFLAGVENVIESGEFFGGATKSGLMFFIVPAGDASVVLFYEPLFGKPIYFGLPAIP